MSCYPLCKLYASHRPYDLYTPDSRFYLRPLTNPSGNVWYSHQPCGKGQLGQMMTQLAKKGELTGRKVTPSTRKTFGTTLVQGGVQPTEVAAWWMEKHSNYKRIKRTVCATARECLIFNIWS